MPKYVERNIDGYDLDITDFGTQDAVIRISCAKRKLHIFSLHAKERTSYKIKDHEVAILMKVLSNFDIQEIEY